MIVKHRKGQSTLEYVLLFTAVMVVLIALLVNSGSPFRSAYNSMMHGVINRMTNGAQTLAD